MELSVLQPLSGYLGRFQSGVGIAFGDGECGTRAIRSIASNSDRLFGRNSRALCKHSGCDSREHCNRTENKTNVTDKCLRLSSASRVESRIGRFPLSANIGLALILPPIAAIILAWGGILFWDSPCSWCRLLAHGALATRLIALSFIAWTSAYEA